MSNFAELNLGLISKPVMRESKSGNPYATALGIRSTGEGSFKQTWKIDLVVLDPELAEAITDLEPGAQIVASGQFEPKQFPAFKQYPASTGIKLTVGKDGNILEEQADHSFLSLIVDRRDILPTPAPSDQEMDEMGMYYDEQDIAINARSNARTTQKPAAKTAAKSNVKPLRSR